MSQLLRAFLRCSVLAAATVLVYVVGCAGGASSQFSNKDAGTDARHDTGPTPIFTGGSGPPKDCTGLQCQIHSCTGGVSTTISGTIYDPAGRNPLYNVVAYVPNSTPQPFTQGASCESCDALFTGDPIATALTDAKGHFTLTNTPDGNDIPLVVQIGKWRRQITIPNVQSCLDNPLPDRSLTLPKNHTEGDIPMIAVSTGGSDTLECLLSRVGVDASEYGPGGATDGHIQIFQGGTYGTVPNTQPPGPQSNVGLWDSTADLMRYDIVLLSCEGEETTNINQQALYDYTAGGGRVFASHFHYVWFNSGPFNAMTPLAQWTTGDNDMGTIHALIQTNLPGGGSFPKGNALHDWLNDIGVLHDDELTIYVAKHNADVGAANSLSTPWILADSMATPPNATEYFSFDTPLGAKQADVCGRVVYSDLHVAAVSMDNPALPVPSDCHQAPLTAQEDALEFMLFDLSSCVTPNAAPPLPPPPIK